MDSLVDTAWLADAHGADDLRVLDATLFLPGDGRDARGEYLAGHIPGALFLDLATLVDTAHKTAGRLPLDSKFAGRMADLGIGEACRIVVYDNSPLRSAARAWWLLRLFGLRQVAVLDGGLGKWRAERRAVESGPAPPRGQGGFVARRDDRLVSVMDDIRAAGEAVTIVDARSPARFRGDEPEPRPGLEAGHIPGARNLHYASLFAADGSYACPEALRRAFEDAGVDLGKPMITTCGSGVTAASLNFAAHLVGKDDVTLYDGSWAEWGADPTTPKVKGPL